MKTVYVTAETIEDVEYGNWYDNREDAEDEQAEDEKLFKVTVEEVVG